MLHIRLYQERAYKQVKSLEVILEACGVISHSVSSGGLIPETLSRLREIRRPNGWRSCIQQSIVTTQEGGGCRSSTCALCL